MSERVFDKSVTITKDNVQYMLTDEQTEFMTKLFAKLKEKSGAERIHVVGESDFDSFVTTYVKILNKRLESDADPQMFIPLSIALVDNGKSGTGKRGILVTKMGVFTIDAHYPIKVDGQDQGGLIPWPLFHRFGCEEVIDDSEDADLSVKYGICLMDAGELDDAERVSQDVKDGAGRETNGDPLYGAWNWTFDRVGIEPDDAVDVVKAMKLILGDSDSIDEDDDTAEDAEEADDAEDVDEGEDEESAEEGDDEDAADEVEEAED